MALASARSTLSRRGYQGGSGSSHALDTARCVPSQPYHHNRATTTTHNTRAAPIWSLLVQSLLHPFGVGHGYPQHRAPRASCVCYAARALCYSRSPRVLCAVQSSFVDCSHSLTIVFVLVCVCCPCPCPTCWSDRVSAAAVSRHHSCFSPPHGFPFDALPRALYSSMQMVDPSGVLRRAANARASPPMPPLTRPTSSGRLNTSYLM